MWIRIAVGTRGYVNVSDDCSQCLSNTNGSSQGQTWGARLRSMYDGFEILTQSPIQRRMAYARAYDSNNLSLAYAPPLPAAEAISSHAPATWMQQQRFGAETPATPTFQAAWGARVNMGDGFNVQ